MEIISGKKENFFNFLDNINNKDKIAVLTHTDLDGITSGIIINEILKNKSKKIKFIDFLNYKKNMFEKNFTILKNKKINKILISDISIDSDYEGYEKLKKDFEVFVIDHHPFEKEDEKNMIKTISEDCTSFSLLQLAREYFKEKKEKLEKLEKLVCATMVCEFSYKKEENLNFIKNLFPEVTIENAYSTSELGKMCKKISSALIYLKNRKKVFKIILKGKIKKLYKYEDLIEKAINLEAEKFKKNEEYFPDKKIHFYYGNPKLEINSTVSTKLSLEKPEDTFIFVSDDIGNKDFIKVNLRSQNNEQNLNLLIRKAIHDLENATGGGHPKAAGGNFLKKDLQRFKENLLN